MRGHAGGARRPSSRGFSLIELMVAVALFSVVMLVSVSSLLALVNANRKAQALQSVMNNLNIALDGMVRAMRMGTTYHCGGAPYTAVADCPNGGTVFAFEPYDGNPSDASDQWVFRYNASTKRLERSENGGSAWIPVTAPEVSIENMSFFVIGSTVRDSLQPKIVVSIQGTAGAEKIKTTTEFAIQATAVQRLLDI